MFGYDNVHTITVCIADPTSDKVFLLGKISDRMAHIEILDGFAVLDTQVLLGDGTGVALTLLDYSTDGVTNVGTISAILGGTTVTWTAATPKPFVLAEGTFPGGHYLALKYDETGTVAPLNMTVSINYVEGAAA